MKMWMLTPVNKMKLDEYDTRGLGPRLRQDKHNMLYTTRTVRSLVYFASSIYVTKSITNKTVKQQQIRKLSSF
jgi:hypothetical protein